MKRERTCLGCGVKFSAKQKKALEKYKYCTHECFLRTRTSKQMSDIAKSGKKHGMSRTRIYRIWGAMKGRCTNKNNSAYSYYGGAGITIPLEWYSFDGFFRDMSDSYEENLTIDRIDGSKGYSKDNCRWATSKEQSSNLKNNVFVMCEGEKVCAQECSRRLGIHVSTVFYRIKTGKIQRL